MDHDAARQFGAYLKYLRTERKLSIRGLATAAGIDSGGLTRLECGKICAPQPNTLRALAVALGVPLADLFTMAGYVLPEDLPSIRRYLRVKYSGLSEEVICMIGNEVERLVAVQRSKPAGPDEQSDPESSQPMTTS